MSRANYTQKRYFVFAVITLLVLIAPFLRIDGNHLFLLSFEHGAAHLFFVKFDMQELYLLPFLFIILFLFIFFMTTLGGRIWCGWSCPQTIFRVIYRDLIQTKILKIYKNTQNKQNAPSKNIFKRALAVIIWAFLSIVIASNFLWYFVPPENFFTYLANPTEHKILLAFLVCIALWLIFDVCYLAENFCIYLCPYARVQSVMFDNDTIQIIYDQRRGGKIYESGVKLWKKPPDPQNECTGCEACVRICPTHIDIRKGMQLECINCLECADACAKVMANFSLPSLIGWTSQNALKNRSRVKFARFRTVAYVFVLIAACFALFLMSGKKEQMLLNINRTSELFTINRAGEVENAYTFLFQNTSDVEHSYYFELDDPNLRITRPLEPITIKAGQKRRVVVTIASNLKTSHKDDNVVRVQINAFATDLREKINITRETIFAYPKENKIK